MPEFFICLYKNMKDPLINKFQNKLKKQRGID